MQQKLKQIFKFSAFRDGQEEIIKSIMDNKDVLGIMPTGGGKSLCYQFPAVVKNGLTIVISPLIALMKDQVDSLRARGIKAGFINSSQTLAQVQNVIEQSRTNQIDLLYVAPERLNLPDFVNLFRQNQIKVNFIAVDEAHCVSQWGHDFRPDYMLIKNFVKIFPQRPIVGAFTATATKEVRQDIINNLELKNAQVFVRGFDRPNLHFSAIQMKDQQRDDYLVKLVKENQGSGIVYAITRKKTEEIANLLNQNGIKAIAYHAGLNSEIRTRVQSEFMENQYKVIVATIAFGMGVNKSDIRFVIHLGMPSSLENYYQEAGRAGRDGEPAKCILLSSPKDYGLQSFFIQKSRDEMQEQGKSPEQIQEIVNIKYDKLHVIRGYAENDCCRRKTILNYFSDPDISKYGEKCDNCDICLGENKEMERDIFFDKMEQEAQERLQRDFAERDFINKMNEWDNFEPYPENYPSDNFKVKEVVNISNTIRETIDLYDDGLSIEKIAQVRGLGVSTILTHLARYYEAGGEVDIERIVTKQEQSQILSAMSKAEDYGYLSQIKDNLPSSISYEKIKMVVAKIKRIKL